MIIALLILLAAPAPAADLPGLSSAPVAASPAAEPVAPKEKKPALMPPAAPARPAGTLETAGEVARDLAVRVEYFENGQSYYRAYTKGSHSPEENKAFLKFLEDYDRELEIARKVHALLGVWLEKK